MPSDQVSPVSRVTVNELLAPFATTAEVVVPPVTPEPVTVTAATIVTSVVPVFSTLHVIVVLLGLKDTLVMVSCSVAMKLNESDPIQTATAMETATVTAMSIIAATTGLRAFLLLRSFFIFVYFPPLSSHIPTQYGDLNLTT